MNVRLHYKTYPTHAVQTKETLLLDIAGHIIWKGRDDRKPGKYSFFSSKKTPVLIRTDSFESFIAWKGICRLHSSYSCSGGWSKVCKPETGDFLVIPNTFCLAAFR